MGQMPSAYALPLEDVIQVLGASAGPGVYQVQADVPAGLLPSAVRRGQHATAEVVIQDGHPVSCVIREHGSNTVILEGASAFETVRSRMQLIWQMRSLDAASTPPQARSLTASLVSPASAEWSARPPRKQGHDEAQVRQIADRKHRLVWMLSNGQRTLSEMAALLQMAPGDIQQALVALAAQGLIADEP
jgi:predicted Rossmann fold nucleotide-binding protein DprA/Smf involved in DNA uptake